MINDLFRTVLIVLFLKRALLQAAPPSLICPEAYRGSNGSCYKLVHSRAHYYFANNECKKDRGGILAQIENAAVDQYIWKEFYNSTRQLFWIGLNDVSQEGIFRWERDGTMLGGYSNWATGQPITISGAANNVISNCVVYNGSGWLLSNCVTSSHNYLCEADVCESVDGITCRSLQQPTSQSEDNTSSSLIIIVIVVIVILAAVAVVMVVLYLMYKKCNGVFMKYICCCGCTTNQDEVLSLQQENQRLRHELSQHKLQLSASPSHNELIKGWSKHELLSGIPDGKGGYLPAIRQSPIGIASPTANDPPALNKSFSGTRVAPAPFVLQSRTQTPTSPFLSRPPSHSSMTRPFTGIQQSTTTTPAQSAAANNSDNVNNNSKQ